MSQSYTNYFTYATFRLELNFRTFHPLMHFTQFWLQIYSILPAELLRRPGLHKHYE